MSSPATPQKYRPDIDGLRALAVGLVVIFHAAPSLLPGGFVGVDIFFVISGFLITGIIWDALDAGRFSIAWFYSRRAKRIFPALSLVLAFVIVAGWCWLLPDAYARLGKHVAGGAAFVANLLLWRESGYFDVAASGKPLLHLWSLGIEEQFYIAWPLGLWLLHRTRIHLYTSLAVVIAASFALNVYLTVTDPVAAFYSPLARFWELALGGLLARGDWRQFATRWPRWVDEAKAWLGLVFILLAAMLLKAGSAFPGGWVLLPTVGAALLISAGPQAWLNRKVLSVRSIVAIGLISYPLYLWHWPLLVFARLLQSGEPSAQIRGLMVAVSVLLAYLTYRLVERPIRSSAKNRRLALIVSAPLAAMLVLGLIIHRQGGFASRYPGEIQGLANFKYDPSVAYRSRSCFLLSTQSAADFKSCTDDPAVPRSAPVLLWGDSYAAALYPGFRHVLANRARLIQLDAVGCAPALHFAAGGKRCEDIVREVMRRVALDKVGRVVMAARWSGQGWPGIAPNVAAAIAELRKLGVKRIDIVGQLPEWGSTLPVSLFQAYQKDKELHQRMTYGLAPGGEALDSSLRAFAISNHVNFISPRDILCNEQGCLTMIGGRLDALTSFDRGHLTVPASEFVVERFPR